MSHLSPQSIVKLRFVLHCSHVRIIKNEEWGGCPERHAPAIPPLSMFFASSLTHPLQSHLENLTPQRIHICARCVDILFYNYSNLYIITTTTILSLPKQWWHPTTRMTFSGGPIPHVFCIFEASTPRDMLNMYFTYVYARCTWARDLLSAMFESRMQRKELLHIKIELETLEGYQDTSNKEGLRDYRC